MPRLAILISGHGSNLQAFIDACASGKLLANISLVISNKPDAAGLQRAARSGIPHICINHKDYASREQFDAALVNALQAHDADLVILAGFMRILTPVLIEPYLGRLMNIHPSLLPKYPGLRTHQRALDAGDKEAGATVHFVTAELDGGPPIVQARVPVAQGDTAKSLAERVTMQEHAIFPLAAQWFLEGRVALRGTKATLDGAVIPATGIVAETDCPAG
ncbi:phosphoribosylglycinamide formyltransferase [Halieaceae bacterium IMCC11814]|uniref:Phosphoribosylglycinamide formyltransferase n=1 Tax=Candidatus Marimicrobium litorale TaxID=2518991 RepID=A0ABT3T2K7_9GAMM|nr:phosphoribosylglycinamide formyltransferase [Candidatus Marimicrobium litorale]